MDVLIKENKMIILLGVAAIFIFLKTNNSKIKYRSEIHIGLKLLYGTIILLTGYLYIKIDGKYILIILLVPLILMRIQLRLGIGEDSIYYIIYSKRFNRFQVANWADIRYPKVYKNDRYTVFEFVDKNGPVKQYFKLEKYEAIKEFIFNKLEENSKNS